jgi:hypothetical protein
MKEQTPIEWLLSKINVNESVWEEIEKYESIAKQKEQKHTQSKVLEVLEGFAKHLEKTGVFVMLDVEEYYETEVKPKYEKSI